MKRIFVEVSKPFSAWATGRASWRLWPRKQGTRTAGSIKGPKGWCGFSRPPHACHYGIASVVTGVGKPGAAWLEALFRQMPVSLRRILRVIFACSCRAVHSRSCFKQEAAYRRKAVTAGGHRVVAALGKRTRETRVGRALDERREARREKRQEARAVVDNDGIGSRRETPAFGAETRRGARNGDA